jgi:hypothetical protein
MYMSDVCMELQNIKYQTMLLNGNSKVTTIKTDTIDIDTFLEKEKVINSEKPWSKLGKNKKIRKLTSFIDTHTVEFECTLEEKQVLKIYLVKCLDRKKLQRVKDVVYDTVCGKIKSIPGLSFDKLKRKFTLKKVDKKRSSLKSLAPKSRSKTRNKKDKKDKRTRRRKRTKIDINLNSK